MPTAEFPSKPADHVNLALTPVILGLERNLNGAGFPTSSLIEEYLSVGFPLDFTTRVPTTQSYSEFPDIYTRPELIMNGGINTGIRREAPVGEYGPEWAQDLITATLILDNAAMRRDSSLNIRDELEIARKQHGDTLDAYTVRKASGADRSISNGFQSDLTEAGWFTQYVVPGYENNPVGLLDALVDQGVFSIMSLKVPPGVTGTLGLSGGVFTSPTIIGEPNRLVINPRILTHFREETGDGKTYSLNQPPYPIGPRQPLGNPGGCPLGRRLPGQPTSAVDISVRLLAQTVRGIQELRDAA